jgi:hypothetical protein
VGKIKAGVLLQASNKAVNKRRDGAHWQVKLISLIWEQWRNVWVLGKSDVHGYIAATKSRAACASLSRELREVYDQRQHVETQVTSLLHHDEHEHHRLSRSTTRNRLALNLPIIRRSVRRGKKRSARGMQSLRTYFASIASDE